LKLFFEAMNIT